MYNKNPWYYFGPCTPEPKQMEKGHSPHPPYRVFATKEDADAFIKKNKGKPIIFKAGTFMMIIALALILVALPGCKKNKCENVECFNAGTCDPKTGDCWCVSPYTGKHCETFSPCSGVTCQNGGTCVNGICNCPYGYGGTYCDSVIDCQLHHHGTIVVWNFHNDSYTLKISGQPAIEIASGFPATIDLPSGSYQMWVDEDQYFIIQYHYYYPNITAPATTFSLGDCQTIYWTNW